MLSIKFIGVDYGWFCAGVGITLDKFLPNRACKSEVIFALR